MGIDERGIRRRRRGANWRLWPAAEVPSLLRPGAANEPADTGISLYVAVNEKREGFSGVRIFFRRMVSYRGMSIFISASEGLRWRKSGF